MIDLVQIIAKKELAVKPSKVVSGLEPENTNIFLQGTAILLQIFAILLLFLTELYKAAVSGNDSKPFVKKILAKYAKMDEEDQEEAKEDKKTAQKEEPVPKKEEIPAKKPAEKPKEPLKKKESLENVEKPVKYSFFAVKPAFSVETQGNLEKRREFTSSEERREKNCSNEAHS